MQYAPLKKAVIERLREELPSHLAYHNAKHTHDVIRAVQEIAKQEGVRGEELILLKTAALFHDTGFLFSAERHEEHSCELASQYLPVYGYPESAIARIRKMIMATRMPQRPEDRLEKILADADLDYLGRDDFFTTGNRLYRELYHSGVVKSEREWNTLQEKFLEKHHYFTETSRKNREERKKENLQVIRSKLTRT